MCVCVCACVCMYVCKINYPVPGTSSRLESHLLLACMVSSPGLSLWFVGVVGSRLQVPIESGCGGCLGPQADCGGALGVGPVLVIIGG